MYYFFKKSMDLCMCISLTNGLGYGQYHGQINMDFKPCTGTSAMTWWMCVQAYRKLRPE